MRRYTPVTDPGSGDNGTDGAHDRVLRRVVGDVDRLGHHVASTLADVSRLRADVDSHSRSLAHLAEALRPPAGVPEGRGRRTPSGSNGAGDPQENPPGGNGSPAAASLAVAPADPGAAAVADDEVAEWLTVSDPAVAIRWLSELDAWVQRVFAHYTRLPACWAWHPTVVAELLTCQQTWIEATTPGAGAAPLAAWHDRWRPGTAHRVTRELDACERTGGGHAGPTGRRYLVDPTVLDELAGWWATTHGTPAAQPPPGLTEEP